MDSQQALKDYDSVLGAWTLDVVSRNRPERRPKIPNVEVLSDLPVKPKLPIWIHRPSDLSEDAECYIPLGKFSKFLRVGDRHFLRGSGRSAKGRNTLRHGRVNWEETLQLNECYVDSVVTFVRKFNDAIDEITAKWYSIQLWIVKPKIIENEGHWYAIHRPKGCIVVLKSRDYVGLFQSYPHILYSERDLSNIYPFLVD